MNKYVVSGYMPKGGFSAEFATEQDANDWAMKMKDSGLASGKIKVYYLESYTEDDNCTVTKRRFLSRV